MTENYANTYQTTLSAAITSTSATTLTVASATGAPSVNFRILIDTELMLVTNVSSLTFTVTRGVEGTTAATHSNGATVTHVLTATGLTQGISDRVVINHSYIGYNTIGGSTENMTNLRVYLKKVTISTPGIITSIGAYIGQTTDNVFGLSASLYQDNSGVAGKIMYYQMNPVDSLVMETSAAPTYTPNWVHCACGVYVTAADYWLGIMGEVNAGTQQLYYDTSGSDHYYTSGGYWFAEGGRYTDNSTSNKYSIRASLIT